MRLLLLTLIVLLHNHGQTQTLVVTASDTSSTRIRTAMHFLERYLNSFEGQKRPDYKAFWSAADCKRSQEPDNMLYTISGDVPTYRFSYRPVLFFARDEGSYVHLKTLFATSDSNMNIALWGITNHYVVLTSQPKFISELELNKANYRTIKNRNISYHFPRSTPFSYARSNKMLEQLKRIERQWGFQPVNMDYYFAANAVELAKMRGMDYNYGMDKTTPSGITNAEQRTIFCHGLGEGYLHEVLHIYFNPVYEKSPMCHAMIYYLAGGIGKDFDWMIRRMNEYIRAHPDLNLSQYETLLSEDPMLHIDYVTKGMICKMMDERNGITGLQRALQYKTVEELLTKEFGINTANTDAFLKEAFHRHEQR